LSELDVLVDVELVVPVEPVVDDAEIDDPDAELVVVEDFVVEEEPLDEEPGEDDEDAEDPVPLVLASAIAGLLPITAPIPSATARAPIRPTYLPSGAAATAFRRAVGAGSGHITGAAWLPRIRVAESCAIELVMSPPFADAGSVRLVGRTPGLCRLCDGRHSALAETTIWPRSLTRPISITAPSHAATAWQLPSENVGPDVGADGAERDLDWEDSASARRVYRAGTGWAGRAYDIFVELTNLTTKVPGLG
jgi:hypothetical protein